MVVPPPTRVVDQQWISHARSTIWRGLAVVLLCAIACPVSAAELMVTRGKWEVLFQAGRLAGKRKFPEHSPLTSLTDLELTGAVKDPFHLGQFKIDGEFGLSNGLASRVSGRNAAMLLLSEVGDFELESRMTAEGLGGWFWLLGWKDGHGYAIYNPTLKTSGSPWVMCELRGGVGIESSAKEIRRWEWKKPQLLKMSIVGGRLNLSVGSQAIAEDVATPNYHPGSLILGTYDTPYGAKPVQIQSIRYRSVMVSGN